MTVCYLRSKDVKAEWKLWTLLVFSILGTNFSLGDSRKILRQPQFCLSQSQNSCLKLQVSSVGMCEQVAPKINPA